MYYVLYDKDFNALGTRKTYPCSSWKLVKKANEFDELVVEGMAIENDDKAAYVALLNEYTVLGDLNEGDNGTMKAIAFSGIPVTNKNKSKINAIDIRQLLNNDCVIKITGVSTISDLYEELLTCLFNRTRTKSASFMLAEEDIDHFDTAMNDYVDVVFINKKPDDVLMYNFQAGLGDHYSIGGYSSIPDLESITVAGYYVNNYNNFMFYICIPKGVYDDLAEARAGLTDTAITYTAIDHYGYDNIGLTILPPDLTEAAGIPYKYNTLEYSTGPGNVWNTIKSVNSIYDCYIDTKIDIINKTLQFIVKKIDNEISIKLEDFGVSKTKRDATKTNRAVCYAENAYYNRSVYYLQADDTVVAESSADTDKILYPPVIEVFEEETLQKAQVKGLQKLYNNRYKASIELPIDNKMGYIMQGVDLSYMVDVYEYKTLPVMETYEDSKGQKKIKLGRMEGFWWQ